ncbi:MAG: HAD family hydrolase [Pseudomonadota bacterium]|nr:HAD family hydrolase [Pseudomonadota bacterium]
MIRPRALLVDLDNTLVDRDAAMAAWLGSLVRGADLPALLLADAGGYGPKEAFFRAVGAAAGLSAARVRSAFFVDFPEHFVLRPDAAALLAGFDGPKVVVTNGWRRLQRAKLARVGLLDRVDHVLVSEEVGVEKPHPAIFHAALACAGCTAAEALMVGDHPVADIAGARGVGIPAVFVRSRWFAPPADVPAIDHLTELRW